MYGTFFSDSFLTSRVFIPQGKYANPIVSELDRMSEIFMNSQPDCKGQLRLQVVSPEVLNVLVNHQYAQVKQELKGTAEPRGLARLKDPEYVAKRLREIATGRSSHTTASEMPAGMRPEVFARLGRRDALRRLFTIDNHILKENPDISSFATESWGTVSALVHYVPEDPDYESAHDRWHCVGFISQSLLSPRHGFVGIRAGALREFGLQASRLSFPLAHTFVTALTAPVYHEESDCERETGISLIDTKTPDRFITQAARVMESSFAL
jgi:hypothetical protein